MDAIGIERGADTPRLLEVPRPEPAAGEALVRTLRVGVDGTDHEELVVYNKAVVGSVNAGRHFEAATDRLAALPSSLLEAFVTEVAPADDFEPAFERGATTIKTAVEFTSHEER